MQMTYNVTCTGPNNCQADNNPSYEPIPGFSAENGMYYDDSGNYAGPPTNFVESCMASKQSVCQLDKARLRAQQIINGFPEECSIEPVN